MVRENAVCERLRPPEVRADAVRTSPSRTHRNPEGCRRGMKEHVVLALDQLVGLVDEAVGSRVVPALLDQCNASGVSGQGPRAPETVIDAAQPCQLRALGRSKWLDVSPPKALEHGALPKR